jgi:hypothetical protein
LRSVATVVPDVLNKVRRAHLNFPALSDPFKKILWKDGAAANALKTTAVAPEDGPQAVLFCWFRPMPTHLRTLRTGSSALAPA